MPDCKSCENKNWKTMYITAQQGFDNAIARLTIGYAILLTITVLCLLTTAFLVVKTQRFIDSFEYVEETEVHIEQDCNGHNTVVLPDGTEVDSNGSGSNNREEEVLAKEENKVNSIIVNK